MTDAIRSQIDELRALLRTQHRARTIVDTVPDAIAALRSLYPANRSAFQREDVQFLKLASAAVEAAEDFCDLVEDLPKVRVPAEAGEYLSALSELEATVHDMAVGRRIRRELRALRERFPNAAKAAAAEARRHRIRALEARAWPCRCGEAMTLRTGDRGGMYWGCSTFPRCRYTHQLTDKQRLFAERGE